MAREHAEHFWPEKPNADVIIDSAAKSVSIFSSTTIASLPPISAITRFKNVCPS